LGGGNGFGGIDGKFGMLSGGKGFGGIDNGELGLLRGWKDCGGDGGAYGFRMMGGGHTFPGTDEL